MYLSFQILTLRHLVVQTLANRSIILSDVFECPLIIASKEMTLIVSIRSMTQSEVTRLLHKYNQQFSCFFIFFYFFQSFYFLLGSSNIHCGKKTTLQMTVFSVTYFESHYENSLMFNLACNRTPKYFLDQNWLLIVCSFSFL